LLVYVDDLLAAGRSKAHLAELKTLLEKAFKLREISHVLKYLGLELIWDRSAQKIWLHQRGYIDKLQRRFLPEGPPRRSPKTPISVDAFKEMTFDDAELQGRTEEEYRQRVGSLQFAACTTRLDIAFACSKLASEQTVRSDQHWKELDRCIASLVGTRDVALELGGEATNLRLVGFADAGDRQSRSSTSGYIFTLGRAAILWASKRIKCVTFSSAESEYISAVEAGKEARKLRFLLAEYGLLNEDEPTTLYVDNQSAISVSEGMGLKGSLTHMERRYMWVQQMVARRKMKLQHILTNEQSADYLTKALHFPAFDQCFGRVGQVRLSAKGSAEGVSSGEE
ncbi:hypothetical protein CLOM_g7686, partial [Closterium sp. NIES-68]